MNLEIGEHFRSVAQGGFMGCFLSAPFGFTSGDFDVAIPDLAASRRTLELGIQPPPGTGGLWSEV